MSANLFKKWQDDWKKGIDKMQENFNKVFKIPPKDTTKQVDSNKVLEGKDNLQNQLTDVNSATNNSALQNVADKGTSLANQNENGSAQTSWQKMVDNSQQTFKKWQTDWDTFIKESQEKTKLRNQKFKEQWDANNQKMKEYFQKQQEDFNQKVKTIEQDMKKSDAQRKENTHKNMETLNNSWNIMVKQQKKDMESFQKMQNRLWWKGYFQFMLWIMGAVLVFAAIFWLLRYLGIDLASYIPQSTT